MKPNNFICAVCREVILISESYEHGQKACNYGEVVTGKTNGKIITAFTCNNCNIKHGQKTLKTILERNDSTDDDAPADTK